MPVIRINANGAHPELHRSPVPVAERLERIDTGPGPAIIMVPGYRYLPGDPVNCPHRHVLSLHPEALPWRAPSWPRQLGFATGHADEGLAVAFGWSARGALWKARDRARQAGRALAQVLGWLQRRHPRRAVHIIAHSLGIEVALEALHHAPANSVGRIISMTGAGYRSRVGAALAAPAGRTAEFVNVTSRENDAFDFLFERLIAPERPGDRPIGRALAAANAVTLQLDCARTLAHLAGLGSPVGPPQHRICHWSAYTRPGILRFYNDLLRRPDRLPLDLLRHGLPGCQPSPWSRLAEMPALALPLSFSQKPS